MAARPLWLSPVRVSLCGRAELSDLGWADLDKEYAAELQTIRAFVRAAEPKVVYADDYGHQDCYRPPVFVKGRSYMYGLSDGEMPDLSPCR